jgi:hypothetical protein
VKPLSSTPVAPLCTHTGTHMCDTATSISGLPVHATLTRDAFRLGAHYRPRGVLLTHHVVLHTNTQFTGAKLEVLIDVSKLFRLNFSHKIS